MSYREGITTRYLTKGEVKAGIVTVVTRVKGYNLFFSDDIPKSELSRYRANRDNVLPAMLNAFSNYGRNGGLDRIYAVGRFAHLDPILKKWG